MLVLRSDSQVEIVARRKWSVRQIIAGLALAGFAYCAVQVGFGIQLLAVAIPFGVVSILLSQWHRRGDSAGDQPDSAMIPFSSFSELRSVRRSLPEFAKKKWPPRLTSRQIRSPLLQFAGMLQLHAVWLMFSPFVLFAQLFPDTESQTFVRT